MAKQFVDINNLKIVWDEINKRFVRSSDFSEKIAPITSLTFNSTDVYQLRPNNKWIITSSFYENFLSFVNSENINLYIKDYDGLLWHIVNKTFYKDGKFYGVMLVDPNQNGNDDIYFYYLKVYQDQKDKLYKMEWSNYGEFPIHDFVNTNTFLEMYNGLVQQIATLQRKVAALEEGNIVDGETTTPKPNYEFFSKLVVVLDEEGNKLKSTSISDIVSIDSIDNETEDSINEIGEVLEGGDIEITSNLPTGTYILRYEDENDQPLDEYDQITQISIN